VNPAALSPLAEIPSPTQSVWYVGSIPIRAYALCIVLGIVAACAVTEIRMRRRGAPHWAVLDIAVWAVPFGIVGARIYHVITSPDDYYDHNHFADSFKLWDGPFWDVFKIWHGGLGIWGAVAGGAVGAWIAARRMGIPLSFVADALAPGLPLAQGIGRWGNWFNNELAGRQTSLPWGLKLYEWDAANGKAVTDVSGHPIAQPGLYHPTFLYESLWDIGVAILVWQLDRRYKFGRGRAFALYVMAYTVGRFWIEALRVDKAHHFLGMRINNWTALLVFAGALIYFLRVRGPQTRLVVSDDGKIQVVPADGTAAVGDTSDGPAPAEAGETEAKADEPEAATGPDETDKAPPPPPPPPGEAGDPERDEPEQGKTESDKAESEADTSAEADAGAEADTSAEADAGAEAEKTAAGETRPSNQ
jgi:phosphatidylglycerol---prolipoprotein diacylglyceryl transferase